MTPETEDKMLRLLASIDARLKSIEEVATYFRGAEKRMIEGMLQGFPPQR